MTFSERIHKLTHNADDIGYIQSIEDNHIAFLLIFKGNKQKHIWLRKQNS